MFFKFSFKIDLLPSHYYNITITSEEDKWKFDSKEPMKFIKNENDSIENQFNTTYGQRKGITVKMIHPSELK